jgi:hypothetical protein
MGRLQDFNGIVFDNPSQIASNSSGHFVEEMHVTQFAYMGISAEYSSGCVIQNNYINAGNNFSAQGIGVAGTTSGNLLESGNLVLRNQVLYCHFGIVSPGTDWQQLFREQCRVRLHNGVCTE